MPASSGHNAVHPGGRNLRRLGLADPGREQGYCLAPGNYATVGTEKISGDAERHDMGHVQGFGAVSVGRQGLLADTGRSDNHPRRDGWQTGSLDYREEIGHDRTGTHSQKYLAYAGARLERHTESAERISGQPSAQPGEPRPGHPAATGENRPTPDRTTGISAALAMLERYTRELGTALVAFERLVERQLERVRERQRSRGPEFGR